MASPVPFRLTLASGSLGRRELLKLHGYSFDVKPSNIDEPTDAQNGDIRRYVGELAWNKAAAVAPQVPDGVVVAADTVAWLDGHVVGKPDDEADARRILGNLSGRAHELWTGVCVWVRPAGWQVCWQEISRVRMKALSSAELDAYIASRKWVGCSGGYTIELPNDPYLTVEEGSVSNVIGLPMESLGEVLAWVAGRKLS